MEVPVFQNEEQIGTLLCKVQGKTLHFSGEYARCSGIFRMYAVLSDREILPLGVLMPDGDRLILRRSLRRRDAGEIPMRMAYGVICPGDAQPILPEERTPETEKPPELPAEHTETSTEPVLRLDRWLETAHPETLTEDPVLQDTLMGAPCALYRYRGGGIELALPEEAHAHLAPAMTMVRAEEIRGAHCFVLTFGPDGLPRRADVPSTD